MAFLAFINWMPGTTINASYSSFTNHSLNGIPLNPGVVQKAETTALGTTGADFCYF